MQIHKSQMLYALLSNPGLLKDDLADIVRALLTSTYNFQCLFSSYIVSRFSQNRQSLRFGLLYLLKHEHKRLFPVLILNFSFIIGEAASTILPVAQSCL